jgi:hypothetical protein
MKGNLLRGVLALTWLAAGAALLSRWFLIRLNDREGGVFAIGVKRWPSLASELDISTEAFRAQGNFVLAAGDENGVGGEALVKWNAESGWLLLLGAALLITALWWRQRRARRMAARPRSAAES